MEVKQIRYLTRGVEMMPDFIKQELIKEFHKQTACKEDWFYDVRVGKLVFYVCDNGEDGFTAMLPSEY